MNENHWLTYKLDGYPNYVIRSNGVQVKVISFHYSKKGKERHPQMEYDFNSDSVKESGYMLYNNGAQKYFKISELIAYYFKQKVKIQRDELQSHSNKKEDQMKYGYSNSNNGVQTGSYIVGSLLKSTNAFSTSGDPAGHKTRDAANTEAQRLARMHPDKKFVVLEVKGVVSVGDAVWQ